MLYRFGHKPMELLGDEGIFRRWVRLNRRKLGHERQALQE